MKKIMSYAAMLVSALVLSACGGSNDDTLSRTMIYDGICDEIDQIM